MEVAAYFRLDKDTAHGIIKVVGIAVSTWRWQADSLGLRAPEIDCMASLFEHKDLDFARKIGMKHLSFR